MRFQMQKSTLRLPIVNAEASSGLTLYFDKLSVLSFPKDAAHYTPLERGLAFNPSPSIELRALSLSKGSGRGCSAEWVKENI